MITMKGKERRTVVKDVKSECREVKSGVLQGLALAPIVLRFESHHNYPRLSNVR